jgi:hypothetical protein
VWDEGNDRWTVAGNALYGTGTLTFSGGGALTGTWSDLGTVSTVDINGGTVDGAVIGGASAAAITGTTLTANTSLTLATGGAMTGVLDSDTMAGTSAALLSTSESIKAYVDSSSKAAGISMTWETATADSDQGVSKVWANHGTLSSATVLYFDDVENNSVSINAFIDSLDDPTASNSATIYIQEAGTATAGVVFAVSGAVTSASSYSKVAVTHLATFGTLSDGDTVGVVVAFAGNNGAGSGDLLASNNLSDVSTAATAFTNIKQAASASATGVVELATAAEINTGTSTTLVVTADTLEQQITGATTAVVTASDEFLFADVGSSNARKKDTVQGILDLAGGGGFVPLSQISSTNQASADFDSLFTSTYNTYLIIADIINPATDDTELYCRLDSNGGASFDAGATDYGNSSDGQSRGGNRYLNANKAFGQMSWLSQGAAHGVYNGAASGISFTMWVRHPLNTTYHTHIDFMSGFMTADTNRGNAQGTIHRLTAQADDSIQFLMSSGNADFEIRAYGVANS